jgi:glutamine phosphoribosylpyrophosphate amidotransferase
MCGVIGFYTKKKTKEQSDKLCELFVQSKIRGLHAFGLIVKKGKDVHVVKTYDLAEVLNYIKNNDFNLLIGHTRYSTSGDYQDHCNNQPIHVDKIALVFNGVISQATKAEYEKIYGKKYITDNDGEIFARKVVDGEDWKDFVWKGKFSFAGIFMQEHRVMALRNKNRPLWKSEEFGARFIGSTNDFFKRSGFKNQSEIKPGELVDLCSKL